MKVVLNADDFGSTERHTRLILDLLSRGRISSTTMLVTLPYAEEAARLIRQDHPRLMDRVGLHFNLIEGEPLNPDLLKSPFVDASGRFKDFRGRVPAWRIVPWVFAVRREFELQLQTFQRLMGRAPSHLDSHGHTHCGWVLMWAFLLSRQARGLRYIRPTRQYDHEPSRTTGLKNRVKNLGRRLFNLLYRTGFRTVPFFTDVQHVDGRWIDASDLRLLAGRYPLIEVMCHPYYFDESQYDFLLAEPNPFDADWIELVSYHQI